MRVAFFLPSLGGGGAEMQALRVANHLDHSRFAPTVVVARRGGAYERQLAPKVALEGLLPRGVKSSALSMALAIPALRLWVGKNCPDVLVSLLPHTGGVCELALRGMQRRPRLVAGVQNNVTRDLNAAANGWMRFLGRRCERFYAQADAIVALSRGVAEDLVRHFPTFAAKTAMVYNAGLDDRVRRLAAQPLAGPRPPGPLVVACGRLSAQKDFPTLLRACAQVLPGRDGTLWLLGRGPDEESLRALARELGLAERVRFLGFQPNPFHYMAAADVFVLSSAWEGFGNVLVEAMACGTAVVSTRCDFGPPEIITHEQDGLLCPVGDPAAMAREISRLLDDAALRRRLAAAGRARAEDFDASRVAAQYAEVLSPP